jgi:hypothetical protein
MGLDKTIRRIRIGSLENFDCIHLENWLCGVYTLIDLCLETFPYPSQERDGLVYGNPCERNWQKC